MVTESRPLQLWTFKVHKGFFKSAFKSHKEKLPVPFTGEITPQIIIIHVQEAFLDNQNVFLLLCDSLGSLLFVPCESC